MRRAWGTFGALAQVRCPVEVRTFVRGSGSRSSTYVDGFARYVDAYEEGFSSASAGISGGHADRCGSTGLAGRVGVCAPCSALARRLAPSGISGRCARSPRCRGPRGSCCRCALVRSRLGARSQPSGAPTADHAAQLVIGQRANLCAVLVVRVGGGRTRRGRFTGFWVARCACGWRGPGRRRRRTSVADAGEHAGL